MVFTAGEGSAIDFEINYQQSWHSWTYRKCHPIKYAVLPKMPSYQRYHSTKDAILPKIPSYQRCHPTKGSILPKKPFLWGKNGFTLIHSISCPCGS